MVELALRVRVREVADAVRPHALGELHRLVPSGGFLRRGAGGAGLGRCVRAQPAPIRATRQGRPAAGVFSSLLHPWIVRGVGVHGRAAVIDGLGAQLVVPGLVAVDLAQPVRGAVLGQPRRGIGGPDVDRVPRHVRGRARGWPPSGRLPLLSRTSRPPRGAAAPGTPGNASRCRRRTRRRRPRHRSRLGAGHRAESESRLATPGISSSKTVVPSGTAPSASPSAPRCSLRRRRRRA